MFNAHPIALAVGDAVVRVLSVGPPIEAEQPLYIRRDVLNADEIIAWAKDAGFTTTLPADDMHITQAYSRAPVAWSTLGVEDSELRIAPGGEGRAVSFLGDKGGIVLKFASSALQRRWQDLQSKGCSWDYEGYQPHVTLTYSNPDNVDPAAVPPYEGGILLGPEKFEALDLDWSDKVVEHALAHADADGHVFAFDPALHPRHEAGDEHGGEFEPKSFEQLKAEIYKEHGVVIISKLKDSKRAALIAAHVNESLRGIAASAPFMPDAIRHNPFGASELEVILKPGKTVFNETHGNNAFAYFSKRENRMTVASGLVASMSPGAPKAGTGAYNVGTDFHSVFAHEMGHKVSGKIAQLAAIQDVPVGLSLHESKSKDYWSSGVSRYASTNHRELMAEAFAAYTHPRYHEGNKLPPELTRVFEAAGVKPGTRRYTHAEYSEAQYAQVKTRLDTLEAKGLRELRAVMTNARDVLEAKIRRNSNLLGNIVKDLSFPGRPDLLDAFRDVLRRAWDAGGIDARREVRAGKRDVRDNAQHDYAGKPEPFTPRNALTWLREKAFWVTDLLADGVVSEVRASLLAAMKSGEPISATVERLWNVFEKYIGDPDVLRDGEPLPPYRLETIIRTNNTDAYNHGRLAEFVRPDMIPFLTALRYSAILDSRTTPVCQYLDDKLFSPESADLLALLPPNHFNCRSIIVPVVVGEKVDDKDFITEKEVAHARDLADVKFLTFNPDLHPHRPAGDEHGGEFAPKGALTGPEQHAVDFYKSTGYFDINEKLRKGKFNELSQHQKDVVGVLDKLTGNSKLAEDAVVYRVIDGKRVGDRYLKVGSIVTDQAFFSTSPSESRALNAVKDTGASMKSVTVIEVKVKGGTPAYDASGSGPKAIIHPRADESELLFGRGSKLRIISVDSTTRRVKAELISGSSGNYAFDESKHPRANDGKWTTASDEAATKVLKNLPSGKRLDTKKFFPKARMDVNEHVSLGQQESLRATRGTNATMAIKDLHPVEPYVVRNHLAQIIQNRGALKSSLKNDPPRVVKLASGKHLLIDGHHRMIAAKLLGDTHVSVRLEELKK